MSAAPTVHVLLHNSLRHSWMQEIQSIPLHEYAGQSGPAGHSSRPGVHASWFGIQNFLCFAFLCFCVITLGARKRGLVSGHCSGSGEWRGVVCSPNCTTGLTVQGSLILSISEEMGQTELTFPKTVL